MRSALVTIVHPFQPACVYYRTSTMAPTPIPLTIPNLVTATRIAMAVIGAWLAARAGEPEAAVVVCIVASLLDAFDGWYARAFAQCSRVGEHMDPLADKILMGVVYGWVGMDAGSALVWSLIALVGAREAAMTVFRSYSLRRHGRYIPASPFGRTKMLVQSVVGLGILGATHILGIAVPVPMVVGGLAVILVLSYASAIAYVVDWKRAGRREEPVHETGTPRAVANS
ncbi:MAG: CDP-alcohol phosphatidyltransferase family protein [Candidatus Latescibacteria bacterium]|nr:CDP-alcohol phosphatidyltransferase family protein [Candidatus Latescibacterota bacterium]